MSKGTSELINDLAAIPSIVAGLGLGIAEAQKAMNLAYLEGIERLLAMIKSQLGGVDAGGQPIELTPSDKDTITALLRTLAPARYQYSETSLTVKLDLSKQIQGGGSVGGGANIGAVMVNAALTVGYAYDYRGAAELKTVIHAAPAGEAVFEQLLGRAATVNDKALTLPAQSTVDIEIIEKSGELFEKLLGEKPKAIAGLKGN